MHETPPLNWQNPASELKVTSKPQTVKTVSEDPADETCLAHCSNSTGQQIRNQEQQDKHSWEDLSQATCSGQDVPSTAVTADWTSNRAAWMGHCVPHLQHTHFSLKNSSHHHWHLHQRLELPPPSLERHFTQDMSVNKLTSRNGLCILAWQSDTCDSSTQALHEETGSESNKDWALTS